MLILVLDNGVSNVIAAFVKSVLREFIILVPTGNPFIQQTNPQMPYRSNIPLFFANAAFHRLLVCAVCFASGVSHLNAEISLGNRGAVAFGLDATAEYDSNINSNSDEEEDLIATLFPKALYRFDQGVLFIDAFAGVEFRRFADNSEFDSENLKSRLEVVYPDEEGDRNYKLELDLGFEESTVTDALLQRIVEKESLFGELTGTYFFTDRYLGRAGLRYEDVDTMEADFNDIRTVELPVEFFYRYSDALRLGLGYQFRDTEVEGTVPAANSTDHAAFFAAEGTLSPNVEGDLRVGVQSRDFEEGTFDDRTSVFLEAEVSWALTERSELVLRGGNEFRTSAANQSVEESYGLVSLRHRFDERLGGRVALGYEEREFSSLAGDSVRNDEEWTALIAADYELIADRLSLNALLSHSVQDSDVTTADYSKTEASVGIFLIY